MSEELKDIREEITSFPEQDLFNEDDMSVVIDEEEEQ